MSPAALGKELSLWLQHGWGVGTKQGRAYPFAVGLAVDRQLCGRACLAARRVGLKRVSGRVVPSADTKSPLPEFNYLSLNLLYMFPPSLSPPSPLHAPPVFTSPLSSGHQEQLPVVLLSRGRCEPVRPGFRTAAATKAQIWPCHTSTRAPSRRGDPGRHSRRDAECCQEQHKFPSSATVSRTRVCDDVKRATPCWQKGPNTQNFVLGGDSPAAQTGIPQETLAEKKRAHVPCYIPNATHLYARPAIYIPWYIHHIHRIQLLDPFQTPSNPRLTKIQEYQSPPPPQRRIRKHKRP